MPALDCALSAFYKAGANFIEGAWLDRSGTANNASNYIARFAAQCHAILGRYVYAHWPNVNITKLYVLHIHLRLLVGLG